MDVTSYLDTSTSGNFVVGDVTYFGTLVHSDASFTLTLQVPCYSSVLPGHEYLSSISGTLFDFTEVTLLHTMVTDCTSRRKSNPALGHSQFVLTVWYIIFSKEPLAIQDSVFSALDFSLPNANDLFYSESFKYISSVTKTSAQDLVQEHLEYLNLPTLFDNYKFGDNPALFLYTGAIVLAELEIPFGTLKIKNNPNYSIPINNGFTFENTISFHIEFTEAIDFQGAVSRIVPLKQVLELLLGKTQLLKNFKLEAMNSSDLPTVFEVYRSIGKQEQSSGSVHATDRLMYIEDEIDEFNFVISEWLLRQEEWKSSRDEFFSLFSEVRYSSDTVVRLCNIFDLIPNSAYGNVKEALSEDLLKAKRDCRAIFKELPPSVEKNSMLNALGRLGTKTLKHKIKDRYKIIQNSNLVNLDGMELVIEQCVDCRNHYVHGSKPNFDYTDNFDLLCFFIDTLTFVYGVSELIECGWSFANWSEKNSLYHIFSRYINTYEWHRNVLKEVLTKT